MPSATVTRSYHVLRMVFGILDILAGVVGCVFYLAGPALIPGMTGSEIFSSVFFISLAFPALVIIMGFVLLFKTKKAATLTMFAAMLLFINSLTALFSQGPPLFFSETAPPAVLLVFSVVTPLAATIFFGLHALAGLLGIMLKVGEPEQERTRAPVDHPEFFCANCNRPLAATDSICPSCKAVIRGIHCVACGFEGSNEEFTDNKCPQCGEKSG